MKKAILTLLMIPAFVGMLFSCSEVKTPGIVLRSVLDKTRIKFIQGKFKQAF